LEINNTLGNGFTELSISCWVKYNNNLATSNNYHPLVAKIGTVGNCYALQNMRSGASSNGGELYFQVNTNTGDYQVFSGVVPSQNVWYNIVGTYDGLNAKIYIDGVLKATLSATGSINTNTQTLLLGDSGYSGYAGWLNGSLDEVSIYSTGLSQSEVTSIFNGGVPDRIEGAISHWRMGEDATFNTNWNVPDQVGSNNGTSANMTIADLQGEAPNYTGGGLSNNMTIEDRVGEAPNSTSNALSYNMTESDRETDVPT